MRLIFWQHYFYRFFFIKKMQQDISLKTIESRTNPTHCVRMNTTVLDFVRAFLQDVPYLYDMTGASIASESVWDWV